VVGRCGFHSVGEDHGLPVIARLLTIEALYSPGGTRSADNGRDGTMSRSSVVKLCVASLVVAVISSASALGAQGNAKHDTHRHADGGSLQRAVAQHIAALTACDANALVAGYTSDAVLFFPDGVVVSGTAALQSVYNGFVKPHSQGGLCGLLATPVQEFQRDHTVFVKFSVTAPFLAAPYFSTDGYIIENGKIASELSTFDASKLKFK